MTYKITRTIHPIFNGKKYEAEVELTVCRDKVYNGDNPIPDEHKSVERIKVLWLTDEEGKEVYTHGNGGSIVVISPAMGLVINDEVGKIEDLEQEEAPDYDDDSGED